MLATMSAKPRGARGGKDGYADPGNGYFWGMLAASRSALGVSTQVKLKAEIQEFSELAATPYGHFSRSKGYARGGFAESDHYPFRHTPRTPAMIT